MQYWASFTNAVFVIFLMLPGCDIQHVQQWREMVDSADVNVQLEDFIRDFTKGYYRFNPASAVSNGLHQYDGRLPDFSSNGIHRYVSWLEQMRARVRAIDVKMLDNRHLLYKEQLETGIDAELFSIKDMKVMDNNAWFGYSGIDPDIYLSRDYAPAVTRMQASSPNPVLVNWAIRSMVVT